MAAAGARPAGAVSAPTLQGSLQQLYNLDASITAATRLLHARTIQAERIATALRVSADRVERLQSQLAWVAQPNRAGELQARLRAASAQLRRTQARARAGDALPQAFALEQQLRRLGAERRGVRALIATLRSAEQAPAVGTATVTRGMWAVTLLHALGAPTCSQNLVSLVAWQSAENTTASWNPLATTLPSSRTTDFNRVGVKNYPSLLDGIDATVATLRGGWTTQGYGWILYRLSRCADPQVTVQAINASNWCRGCARGGYVVDTLPFVENDYEGYAER